MKRTSASILLAWAAACLPAGAAAQSTTTWTLEASTITYHVTHPLHKVDGVSHQAKGKGTCRAGRCDFLIAAPVNSFDSEDTNRDLHMIQTTRGAQFPMVIVRTSLPDDFAKPELVADLAIEFAGAKATYPQVRLHKTDVGGNARLTGTIPLNIGDFKIDPPALLTSPIKLEVPVDVDLIWRKASAN